MSSHLPKSILISSVGISVSSALIPMVAQSQSKPAKSEATPPRTVGGVALPDPNAMNKKIQEDYPAEIFDDPNYTKKGAELNGSAITNSNTTANGNMTAVGNSNYTFVLSTPLLIAMVVV
jgi:hypothetical protein